MLSSQKLYVPTVKDHFVFSFLGIETVKNIHIHLLPQKFHFLNLFSKISKAFIGTL